MIVKWTDLLESFEFISSGGMGEQEAFLCRESGAVFWRSELSDLDELPEDIEDEAKYLRIPDRRDLDLGKPLALGFTAAFLPDDIDEVRQIFSRKGAYGKFKTLLDRRRAIERWHRFEDEAAETALREWCKAKGITIDG